MSLGSLMIDIQGTTLNAEDRNLLAHPAVGGVILFSRNYESREQLTALNREIHALRTPQLLIAVDHEGGWLMASELRATGVDFSFAPILDLYSGHSRIINDRAFHATPEIVARLAQAYVRGMHAAGMAAVGKHFPGHGSVVADSHHELPVDRRTLQTLRSRDLLPFRLLAAAGIEGMMPAHILFPKVDSVPVGYSSRWLRDVLRRELEFKGVIFSDDLSMSGAAITEGFVERTHMALSAGCDMCLICNDRAAASHVIGRLEFTPEPLSQVRLMRMHGRRMEGEGDWLSHPRREEALAALSRLDADPTLALGDDAPA